MYLAQQLFERLLSGRHRGAVSIGHPDQLPLTQEKLPSGHTVSYTWDGVDNLSSKADGSGTTSYTYTVNDELHTVKDPLNNQISLAYDQDGNRTQVAYPNGVTETMAYDSAGQLTSITAKNSSNAVLNSFSYSYTNPANGQPTTQRYSVTTAANHTTNYTYDTLNRLTQAVEKDGGGATVGSYSYAYDPVSNITSQNRNGTASTLTYNGADQLTAAGSTSYSYDLNGNLTSVGLGNGFAYNPMDQTSSITPPGQAAIAMGYSGTGQAQRTGTYDYDETGIDYLTTAANSTYLTNGPDGEVFAQRIVNGSSYTVYYYLYDGLGSVVGLTDSTGAVVNSYSYDPYGNATSVSETVSNPFRYTGAIWDSSTGLYKMGERYYDPSVGRFTQPDPLDGASYTYADGNPVNEVDPSGLSGIAEPGGGGAGYQMPTPVETACAVLGYCDGGRPAPKSTILKKVVKSWDKATFRSRAESIRYHYKKHGSGQGIEAYTQEARDFWGKYQNYKKRWKLKDGRWGWKIKKGKHGGIYTHDGKIITYW